MHRSAGAGICVGVLRIAQVASRLRQWSFHTRRFVCTSDFAYLLNIESEKAKSFLKSEESICNHHFDEPDQKQRYSRIRSNLEDAIQQQEDPSGWPCSTGGYTYFYDSTPSVWRHRIDKDEVGKPTTETQWENEIVIDADSLAKSMPSLQQIVEFLPSTCHRFIVFVTESVYSDHTVNHVFVKDVAANVACMLTLNLGKKHGPHSGQRDRFAWMKASDGYPVLVFIHPDTMHPPITVYALKLSNSMTARLFGDHTNDSGRQTLHKQPQLLRSVEINVNHVVKLHTEKLPGFILECRTSKDGEALFVGSHTKSTSELKVMLVNENSFEKKNKVKFTQLCSRNTQGSYFADMIGETLFESTSRRSSTRDLEVYAKTDFKVSQNDDAATLLWPPKDGSTRSFRDAEFFRDSAIMYGTLDGMPSVDVTFLDKNITPINLNSQVAQYMGTPFFSIVPGLNDDPDAIEAAFSASCPTKPEIPFLVGLNDGTVRLAGKKVDSDMNASLWRKISCWGESMKESASEYFQEGDTDFEYFREYAESHDGVKVPVTFVRLRKTAGESNPTALLGYGAYGMCQLFEYNDEHFSMLQRGWTIAYAHTRGGGEYGEGWHRSGSRLEKWNTFEDFHACAALIVDKEYSEPSKLCAVVSSAGGLIGGVMANEFPHLFAAIVMRGAFLDVIESMTRPELTLTAHEYDEWGDPNDIKVLEYMRTYCPCSNVRSQRYPRMMVTAGLRDPLVDSWNSARWVALVREHNLAPQEECPIVLNMLAYSGHEGPVQEDEHLHLSAMEMAFLDEAVGM